MPPKRVYLRKRRPARVVRRKRVFRKKKSRFSQPSLLKYNPRNRGVLVPDRYMTTMKCSSLLTGTAASGLLQYDILGNGLLDPLGGASTANVTGLVQLGQLYQRYIIHGSRVRVEAVSNGTGARLIMLYPYQGTLPTTTRAIMDNAYVKSKLISAGGGMDRTVLTAYMSTKKISGLKDLKDEENQWGTSSSNPGFQWLWNLRSDNGTGADTPTTTFRITVTYYVEWFDRLELNQA